jgi:TRAP-type C4-dicarboxylate transport system substrate-binding protein
MRVRHSAVAGILLAALAADGASAAEVTLRAVSAFAETTANARHFERFVQKVNAEGRGLVQINDIGGPKAMPPFEVGNAVKNGVIDVANVTGAFYTNLLPEADALTLSTLPAAEMRKNGAHDYVNRLWGERMNADYLARAVDNSPFHLNQDEIARQEKAGIQVIRFSGSQGEEWVKKAYDVAWASIARQSPEYGPRLRALISR